MNIINYIKFRVFGLSYQFNKYLRKFASTERMDFVVQYEYNNVLAD